MKQLPANLYHFCQLPKADLYYHIFSTSCVFRVRANEKLVTSKRIRNKACNLAECHYIMSSQGLSGKHFSHVMPVRNNIANSTTCRSTKLCLGMEFENFFPSTHSLPAAALNTHEIAPCEPASSVSMWGFKVRTSWALWFFCFSEFLPPY